MTFRVTPLTGAVLTIAFFLVMAFVIIPLLR